MSPREMIIIAGAVLLLGAVLWIKNWAQNRNSGNNTNKNQS